MGDFLQFNAEGIGYISAIVGALTSIFIAVRKVRPVVDKRRKKTAEKEQREEWLYRQIQLLSDAFTPNGGTSLYDRIVRMDTSTIMTEARIKALIDLDPYDPIFETDPHGGYTTVNRVWGQYTGLTQTQALGNGWIVAVHEEDRDRVWKEWTDAIAQQRDFDMTVRLVNQITGQSTSIHYRAVCSRKSGGGLIGWIGVGQLVPAVKRH